MSFNPNQPRVPKGNTNGGRWTKYLQAYQKARYIYSSDIPDDINPIDIEIDELVPCLRDTSTGSLVDTVVRKMNETDLLNYNMSNGWLIDWHSMSFTNDVYGVFVKGKSEPEGMIALKKDEGFMYISFVCVAPHNNKLLLNGVPPKYKGVGGHLFAVAILKSVSTDFGGCVVGVAKNKKVLNYYVTKLGAEYIPFNKTYRFAIYGKAAIDIVRTYNYEAEGE